MSGSGGAGRQNRRLAPKPILLGEAPSRGGDRYHMFPLSGPPARALCTMAGISPQPDGSTYGRWTWALYDAFDCHNLFDRYAEATPWSVPRARDRAAETFATLHEHVVVMLGRRVQAAFGISGEFYDWQMLLAEDEATRIVPERPGLLRWAVAVAIPHPSGLNRALNDPAERQRCGETLRRAVEYASSGHLTTVPKSVQ